MYWWGVHTNSDCCSLNKIFIFVNINSINVVFNIFSRQCKSAYNSTCKIKNHQLGTFASFEF